MMGFTAIRGGGAGGGEELHSLEVKHQGIT